MLSAARAPRLRRIAELIDTQAQRTKNPAMARAIACEMRLRASELEAGSEQGDEPELLLRLLLEMGSAPDV